MGSVTELEASYAKENHEANRSAQVGQSQGDRVYIGLEFIKNGQDVRRVASIVWHDTGIPAGVTITQAQIRLWPVSATGPFTHQTGWEVAIPRIDGAWNEPSDTVVARSYLKQIAMKAGTIADDDLIYSLPGGAIDGGGFEMFAWGRDDPSGYRTDGTTEPTYTQIFKCDATTGTLLEEISLIAVQSQGAMDPSVKIHLEVYDILGDDIVADEDGALLATSETLLYAAWSAKTRTQFTAFSFLAVDGGSGAPSMTQNQNYRLKVVFSLDGWAPPSGRTGGLHGTSVVHGETANELPNNVANLTAGVEVVIAPGDRHFWAPLASATTDVPHLNNYLSDDQNSSNVGYASGIHSPIETFGSTPFTIGDAGFSPDYELDMASVIQDYIDDPAYVTDAGMCIVVGLKDVFGAGADIDVRVFLPLVGIAERRPHLWIDFTVPAPTLTLIDPVSGPTAGGTPVTITGTGFVDFMSVLTFGGTSATPSIDSTTTITATTPAHAAGAEDVFYGQDSPSQDDTLVDGFLYIDPTVPTLNSIDPISGPPAFPGTIVDLFGFSFVNGASVSFGGTDSFEVTFISQAHLTARTPFHAVGLVDVIVTNPAEHYWGPQPSNTLVDAFLYILPAPVLTSIDPVSGPTAGGTQVGIDGTDFVNPPTVTFDGVPATGLIFVNPTRIAVDSPAHVPGTVDVVVTNPDAQFDTLASAFTYIADAPAVEFVVEVAEAIATVQVPAASIAAQTTSPGLPVETTTAHVAIATETSGLEIAVPAAEIDVELD